MQIYLAINGSQAGPFTEQRTREMLAENQVSLDDLAWVADTVEWVPLRTLLPSSSSSGPPPPLPPTAFTLPPTAFTLPPPAAVQPPAMRAIIRDVIIIMVLTALGGFVVGFISAATHQPQQHLILAIALSNLLFGTVGFTIVGCRAPGARWPHLWRVALGSWIASLINVAFGFTNLAQWVFASVFMILIMGLGGALSYLFRKDDRG